MTVYVESNFVLEQALQQEQSESCDSLVRLAEAGDISLVIPAFSLAEPHIPVWIWTRGTWILVMPLDVDLIVVGGLSHFRNDLAGISSSRNPPEFDASNPKLLKRVVIATRGDGTESRRVLRRL